MCLSLDPALPWDTQGFSFPDKTAPPYPMPLPDEKGAHTCLPALKLSDLLPHPTIADKCPLHAQQGLTQLGAEGVNK